MRQRFETVGALAYAMGGVLVATGVALLLPLIVAAVTTDHARVGVGFGVPAVGCIAVGLALLWFLKRRELTEVSAMLLCGLAWSGFAGVGALPYVLVADVPYIDAVFETVSGVTTTGITMLSSLDDMPRSLLVWRALTQWFGGLGILTFFLAVTRAAPAALAPLGTESHKISTQRPAPGLFHTLRILFGIYIGLTVLVIIGLLAGGVSVFDAICHAFTTVSTGGFSTHDASIGWFSQQGNAAWIEWVLIAGMLAGGTSFLVHYRLIRGRASALISSPEIRWWWISLAVFVLLVLAERWSSHGVGDVADDVRRSMFAVVAIATTTGYATEDIGGPWFGDAARVLFLVMMFVGGNVGSTGGGFKVQRVALLAKLFGRQLYRLTSPRGAIADVVYDGKTVPSVELDRVSALLFAWIASSIVAATVTAAFSDHDPLASISGALSALNNIGPCYIPVEEMAQLHPATKCVYMLCMLAGRLEMIPIALLFSRRAWRGR